jgi:hypothetical protein
VTNEERIASLEHRISTLETRITVAEVNIDHINRKLDKIDSNTTWLLRIVIGFAVTAVLGFVFTQTK